VWCRGHVAACRENAVVPCVSCIIVLRKAGIYIPRVVGTGSFEVGARACLRACVCGCVLGRECSQCCMVPTVGSAGPAYSGSVRRLQEGSMRNAHATCSMQFATEHERRDNKTLSDLKWAAFLSLLLHTHYDIEQSFLQDLRRRKSCCRRLCILYEIRTQDFSHRRHALKCKNCAQPDHQTRWQKKMPSQPSRNLTQRQSPLLQSVDCTQPLVTSKRCM
jgi:hypothetical protein